MFNKVKFSVAELVMTNNNNKNNNNKNNNNKNNSNNSKGKKNHVGVMIGRAVDSYTSGSRFS